MAVSVQYSVLVNGLEIELSINWQATPYHSFQTQIQKVKARYQKSLAVMRWFSCGMCDKDLAIFQIFVCIFIHIWGDGHGPLY